MPTGYAAVMWEREQTAPPQDWASQPEHEVVQGRQACSDSDPELKAEIERAGNILSLQEDWDGEGSIAYSKDTLDRAVKFLASHSDFLWKKCGLYPPVPTIGPGPEGSIDLHWRRGSWELLVNIPSDPNEMAVFYGDNYGVQKIKGSFDPNTVNVGLAAWLMT